MTIWPWFIVLSPIAALAFAVLRFEQREAAERLHRSLPRNLAVLPSPWKDDLLRAYRRYGSPQ